MSDDWLVSLLFPVPDWLTQRGSTESVEWKRRDNDRTSDISTADDSMTTGRRLVNMTKKLFIKVL